MTRNKSIYQQYKRTLCYFKISLWSESISPWLLLASLFYKCKRYPCFFFSCTPDKMKLNHANSLAEQTVFKHMTENWWLLHAFKYLFIDNVCFQYPFCLLPYEIISLITDESLYFPPFVYSYLLQCLCCYHLGDVRGKQNALHDLELTIKEGYFIVEQEIILKTV